MKKLLLLLFFVVNIFAINEAQAISAVKANPALLNTPQAQAVLQQKGLTKQDVLNKLNKSEVNNNQQKDNKVKNNITIKNKKVNKLNPVIPNNQQIKTPLKYIPAVQLIKNIQSHQQKSNIQHLSRFGARFFYNKNSLNSKNLAVPDYYEVNVGDMVKIQIFGGNDKTINTKVNNNGNINLPVVGPIHVAGMSVYNLKQAIKRKLKPTYRNYKIVVNVSVNSFIQVTLTGFVKAPGIYNLNSLSTIKDLLITANGFGKLGSMRNVYLKRGNKVIKIIDFYKLIKNGEVVDNTLLRNGDIIYVPKAKKLVKLSGAVNIPAIYELKDNDTLKSLINYAGGLTPNGSSKFIKIKEYESNSYVKVLFKDINSNLKLLNGDEIFVYKISELNKNYVNVYGNIEKPGSFEIPKDKKLATLLKKLTYLKDTYKDYGLIERFDGKIVSFSIKNPQDITLESKDKIYIFNKYQIMPNFYVTIKGDVVKSAKLRFFNGMTLKDVINNAGANMLFDKSKVQISRYNKNLERVLKFVDYNKNKDMKILPFDEITLYKYVDFHPLQPVLIYGEVNKPHTYLYSKNLTLNDLIKMGGGFNLKADKHYIELIRYKIVDNQRVRVIKKLDFNKDKNLAILPYDEINVKRIPNWYDRISVTIKGAVKYPGVYIIKQGETLDSVIKRAGGFNKNAYLYGAVFTRESVKKLQTAQLKKMIYRLKKKVAVISASAKGAGEGSLDAKNLIDAIDSLAIQAEKLKPIGRIAIKLDNNLAKFQKSPYNITLENHDNLYIPTKPDTVTTLGEVLTPSAFVYTSNEALDYIKKSGGVTDLAGNVYFVVHANGFTQKEKVDGWFNDIKVKPGDVITVPITIKTSTWYGIAKDITSIVYQLAITAASLKTVGAL